MQDQSALLILSALTLLAISQAINAKGHIRIILSSALALLVLGLTLYQATLGLVNKSLNTLEESSRSEQKPPSDFETQGDFSTAQNDSQSTESDSTLFPQNGPQSQQELTDYINMASALILDAKAIGQKLSSHKVVPDNDEEYEVLLQKSSFYLTESQKIKRTFLKLKPLSKTKLAHETLSSALDNLVLATGKLRKFYSAENSAEELAASDIFRNKYKQALSQLDEADKLLGPTP